MESILEVNDLSVYYGVIQALKGISFKVNKGEVVALIGANLRKDYNTSYVIGTYQSGCRSDKI